MRDKILSYIGMALAVLVVGFVTLKVREYECLTIAGTQGYEAVYKFYPNVCYINIDGKLIDYNKFVVERERYNKALIEKLIKQDIEINEVLMDLRRN